MIVVFAAEDSTSSATRVLLGGPVIAYCFIVFYFQQEMKQSLDWCEVQKGVRDLDAPFNIEAGVSGKEHPCSELSAPAWMTSRMNSLRHGWSPAILNISATLHMPKVRLCR